MPFSGPLPLESLPPPWYKQRLPDSDNDDHPDSSTSHEFLAGASTPLHVNPSKLVMMISPMKKLDKLHLTQGELGPIEASDDEENSLACAGNQTILTDYSSDLDLEERPPPMFVRKRKHDSSLDMIITPAFNYVKIKSSDLPASRDSFVDQNSCESLLKISFSTSYSTPCPIQPRKKLKLKDDSTPSHPLRLKKPLLNLSCSTKVSAGSEPLIDKLNNAGEEDSFGDNSVEEEPERNPAQSTPISQSTPANSRAPSPFTEDTSGSINGFSFVKPVPAIPFKYETPQARPTSTYPSFNPSQQLKNAYNNNDFAEATGGKYEVVGKFPMSAAGLMDEGDEDLHVGDKRINDPYLQAPVETSELEDDDKVSTREAYLSSNDKLPLLLHFESELSKQEMLDLIQDSKSVSAFYDYISEPNTLMTLLKKERLRWHPDKWVSRYESSQFDEEVIRSLSQVINALIETS
ncbi:hypothetical protein C7M61_004140 [Candidozyma pseudohaemuli]|uniref:Uncharacterized protein n=1 Tax=Candidozyma pseudohaemuli TaxID=418784 RepID=A0A2P7YK34_9ASCO|nr:hypothetical protein C7M61_004140 [[Candida] pseudohaemulonii]PSK36316.1 hypothetical protein C7M61_004140 [[Candida] pseudohaemulonii]